MCIKNKLTASVVTALASCLGVSSGAHADPLPGEILSSSSCRSTTRLLGGDLSGARFAQHGLSVCQPEWNARLPGLFLADDFADKFSTPVVHLKWWGSYINNPNNSPVNQFLISLNRTSPAGGRIQPARNSTCHPDREQRCAGAGVGTFTER